MGSRRLLIVSKRWGDGIAMLYAGFYNLSGEPLGDFDRLGHIPPLGNKARNVGTSSHVTALFQWF